MVPASLRAALAGLKQTQQRLEERAQALGTSPQEVLELGNGLLEFAEHEDEAFAALATLIDPEARAELAAEHQQLAADLDLLAWLLSTSPDSPDVDVLSAALARRMREHMERDGRLIARAARM